MARTEAAEKIELPDTLQVGLMHESQKNHAINMGHLAFDLATLRASSMFNVKSMEIAHMHMMQTLDSVAANELLTSDDPAMAGLMNMFARVPNSIEHPAFAPSQNQPMQRGQRE